MSNIIKEAMPMITEIVIFVLTVAAFSSIYKNEYGDALVFGMLIVAAQLQKIADILDKK
jgi:uncharacterized membrane protein